MTGTWTVMTLIKNLAPSVSVCQYAYSPLVEQVPIIYGNFFPSLVSSCEEEEPGVDDELTLFKLEGSLV